MTSCLHGLDTKSQKKDVRGRSEIGSSRKQWHYNRAALAVGRK